MSKGVMILKKNKNVTKLLIFTKWVTIIKLYSESYDSLSELLLKLK